ncbi:hypothetical protein A5886_001790 [Enterococcus sp. 8G7_MSG3316]|uniref:Uncharacterized protein n=1 Tax=Candidatus Enterococcus testudinis TaxID=1834191 RepID=A0A242A7K6_9ENTE|nr:nucleoid-associated protein [Enterococcus sp. 8G7_MSG3316]OTN76711.1 hypothetical protein A5886_001790 [Enterococcus sp. 8G7_MSG3316]
MIKYMKVFEINPDLEVISHESDVMSDFDFKIDDFFRKHIIKSTTDPNSKAARFRSDNSDIFNPCIQCFTENDFDQSSLDIANHLKMNMHYSVKNSFLLVVLSYNFEEERFVGTDEVLAIMKMELNEGIQMNGNKFKIQPNMLPDLGNSLQKCAFIYKSKIENFKDNTVAVSYTHLDVYKRISGSFIPNVISSIFSFRLETEKIDYELSNFIQIQSKYDRNISSVPFLLDSIDFLSSNLSRRIMIDALSNIFDNKNGNSLLIIKQSVKVIEIDKLSGDFEKCYEIISRINEFIFGEPSNYREKLRILRNLLYEGIDEENNNIYDQDFWNKLLILSINEYNIYVDEKVTKFISEKKEIIKEQFSMSKEISNQIAETKKSLMNNIVSIIGIFLSKFIFDAISRNDEHLSFFSYLIALFFSVYLLVIYFISGEFKSYQTYVKRVEIMNTYYPKLYLTKDNIIGDLEEKISNPEIKKLKYVNITAGICYVFFVVLFLQRLGFFDLFIRTIFTPDK